MARRWEMMVAGLLLVVWSSIPGIGVASRSRHSRQPRAACLWYISSPLFACIPSINIKHILKYSFLPFIFISFLDLIINDSCSIAACKNDVRTVGIWFHFSFFFGSYQIARQGRIVSKCWATIVVYSLIGRSSPHFIRYFFLFLCYSLDGGFDEWLPAAADALPWSIRRCHLGKVDNVHAGHYLKKI